MAVTTKLSVVGAKGTYLLIDNDDAKAQMVRQGGRWSISVAGTVRSRKYNRLDIALQRFADMIRRKEKY